MMKIQFKSPTLKKKKFNYFLLICVADEIKRGATKGLMCIYLEFQSYMILTLKNVVWSNLKHLFH